ncbi:MAG: M14 family metallopeptidase [Bernardetiaceae bacterium]|nr:M14 family metallopeptidase [Bernardetiaceae bacterium]
MTQHIIFKILFFCISIIGFQHLSQAQKNLETPFEKSNGKATATYYETIEFYKNLASSSRFFEIKEVGMTDAGLPLHTVIFSADRNFEPPAPKDRNKEKTNSEDERKATTNEAEEPEAEKMVLLILNGIHPGEPDGIDASMLWCKKLANDKNLRTQYENLKIVIIPCYNIGGALNRNSHTRVNQNGPAHYGFRGNAQNYDLNRDFIKQDSKNAKAFAEIFHHWKPHFFLDTHVSNGADYPYTLTYLASQYDKAGPIIGSFMRSITPILEQKMAERGEEIIPYVNIWNDTPDKGYTQFYDSPRYSSGYATLFQTPSIVIETHMLKPFDKRVEATLAFFEEVANLMVLQSRKFTYIVDEARAQIQLQSAFPLDWLPEKGRHEKIKFKAYKADSVISEVSGLKRLRYDPEQIRELEIPYYTYYREVEVAQKPFAYIIPQAWHRVIAILESNGVRLERANSDKDIKAEVYYIRNYKTSTYPYEGHYLHSDVRIEVKGELVKIKKGDYIVYTEQPAVRYLVETLEPHAPDSFFNWNFFDSILQQKEGFSDYVFEDLAAEILRENPNLRKELEEKRKKDPVFAKDARAQLDFVYKNSPHYLEQQHLRYPVVRTFNEIR